MRPGDIAVIYPGEIHWHGATPDNMFSHTAIQMVKDEGIIISEVTSEEYGG
jgi:quercetin dioxygenase-like cupin family protein